MQLPWGLIATFGALVCIGCAASYYAALRWASRSRTLTSTSQRPTEIRSARLVGAHRDSHDGVLIVRNDSVRLVERGKVTWSAETANLSCRLARDPRPTLEMHGGTPLDPSVLEPLRLILDSASPVPVVAGRIGLARQRAMCESVVRFVSSAGVLTGASRDDHNLDQRSGSGASRESFRDAANEDGSDGRAGVPTLEFGPLDSFPDTPIDRHPDRDDTGELDHPIGIFTGLDSEMTYEWAHEGKSASARQVLDQAETSEMRWSPDEE